MEKVQRKGATRADVARLAGVSTAVVSYALNGGPKPVAAATRERVLEAVRMLDYRPNAAARALSRGHSDLLALVIPSVEQPYFAHLAAAVEREARAQGLSLIVANALAPRVGSVVRELVGHQLRGLILAAAPTPEATREFLGSGIPTILINQAAPVGSLLTLGPDFRKGAADGVRHLLDVHGHRRIAHIGGDITGDDRMLAWRITMGRAGLDAAPAIECEYSQAGGREAMRTLLRAHPGVAAVFCASDEIAIGAISALDEAGKRAPDDMAIVAFDGSPESEFATPPLTTVGVPMAQMAQDALERVLGDVSAGHVRYETELIVRCSCGCR